MHEIKNITITPEILKLIAEIDEFKGRWTVIETLAPERLTSLRRIATIESVGSSTRIEGAKLSDAEVEKLLSGLRSESFASRDEQEVAGYADAMDMIFDGFAPALRSIPLDFATQSWVGKLPTGGAWGGVFKRSFIRLALK